MDSYCTVSVEEVEALLKAMKKHNRPARIDWTNRVVNVLSKPAPVEGLVLSTGQATAQTILFQIDSEGTVRRS